MSEKSKKCVLCNSEDETLVIVGKRGIEILINSAVEREEPYYKFVDGIVVHEDCRKNYVSKRNIQQFNQRQLKASQLPVGKRTRSSSAPPNIKLCLFCGIELEHANGGKENINFVSTTCFGQTIRDVCKSRNDSWAHEVLGNLNAIGDCVASNAGYHISCSQHFRSNRQKPNCFKSPHDELPEKKKKSGRPLDDKRIAGFQFASKYFEDNDEEVLSISHLCDLMGTTGCQPYSTRFMKTKLIEKYKEDLVIVSSDGLNDIVSLRKTADKIIKEFHDVPRRAETEEEKLRIIQTAASIIRNDIKDVKCRTDIYDIFDGLANKDEALEFLPVSLQIFLSTLMTAKGSKDKIISLGQALMQATCPRKLIAPYQVNI